jgi:hypothetical protein
MIEKKNEFFLGLGLMIGFVVVLLFFFMPLIKGKNGLDYLDTLYNSISKGSAYYIPSTKKEVQKFANHPVSVSLNLPGNGQAAQTALLFAGGGAKVDVQGTALQVSGDLAVILERAISDADDMYWNKGETISGRYGYEEKRVLYNWWKGLEELQKGLNKQKKFKEAKIVALAQKRALEPSYNYYTVEPQKIGARWGTVVFSLLFYVVYTLWYGFAMLFMFEGWGLKLGH